MGRGDRARSGPRRTRASAGQAYLASRNGLVSSSASIASQRSSGNSATGATCWKPALATTASRRPKRSSAASTAARLPSRVVRSAANGSPGPSSVGLEVDGEDVAPRRRQPLRRSRGRCRSPRPVTIAARPLMAPTIPRDGAYDVPERPSRRDDDEVLRGGRRHARVARPGALQHRRRTCATSTRPDKLAMIHEHFDGDRARGALGRAAGALEPLRQRAARARRRARATASRCCCRRRPRPRRRSSAPGSRGAILLSMSVLYGDDGIRHRVSDSQAKVLVTNAANRDRVDPRPGRARARARRRVCSRARRRTSSAWTRSPTTRRSSTTRPARPGWRRASCTRTATCSRTRSSSTATTCRTASASTAWASGRGRRASRRCSARGASARSSSSTSARAASTRTSSSTSSRATRRRTSSRRRRRCAR